MRIGRIPDGVPVYQHIKSEIKRCIDSGELQPDDRVPSELELSRDLGISRSQARQALRDLELEGYLVRRRGLGSFVSRGAGDAKQLGVTGFRVVAMAIPTIYSSYMRHVIDDMEAEFRKRGFRMLTYFTSTNDESEREFLYELQNSGIEGLALWITNRSQRMRDTLRSYQDAGFPFVLWDRYVPGMDTDFVGTDNVDVGYRLTKKLCEHGHRRIGFISMVRDITSGEERFEGYRRALEEAGTGVDDGLVAFPLESSVFPGAAVREVLARTARPTAFYCTDETGVRALVPLLRELKYEVPRDMAIAALDDSGILGRFGFPMPTARQRTAEIARQTAKLLIKRIETPSRPAERRLVAARFTNAGGAEERHAG